MIWSVLTAFDKEKKLFVLHYSDGVRNQFIYDLVSCNKDYNMNPIPIWSGQLLEKEKLFVLHYSDGIRNQFLYDLVSFNSIWQGEEVVCFTLLRWSTNQFIYDLVSCNKEYNMNPIPIWSGQLFDKEMLFVLH